MKSMDWTALLNTPRTVTVTDDSGQPVEATITPVVRDRVRHGERRVTVNVLPLLADRLTTVKPQYRAFAGDMLRKAKVELREHPHPLYAAGAMRHVAGHRLNGRVRTTYNGDGILPVDDILDIGEQLWHYFMGSLREGEA